MKNYRVIELSHELVPGKEEYTLEVETRFVDEMLPGYHRPKDAWYVLSKVNMGSHVGTHIEAPLHYLKDGVDVAGIALNRVVGEAIVLDFQDKKPGDAITQADMEQRGSDIRQGDIVFIRTGLSINYRTERSRDRPYFAVEAIRWLVERNISCLGVDCSGIEKRDEPDQPDHQTLFSHGIPLIEHLANLDQLSNRRFFVVAVPWRVHGLEAIPASVVAFESEAVGEPF
jgi:arylformamidase